MRTISNDLKAEIKAGRIARLLKITCKNGDVYAFTDTDMPLVVDSVKYTPAPGLQSVKLTATSDVQISNQEIGAALSEIPEQDLIGGVFDSAEIIASWASWANPGAGKVDVFVGTLGEVTWDDRGFVADVVSNMKAMERIIGWQYTATCRHTLYGGPAAGKIGSCGVNPATFTFTGSVSSILTPKWRFTASLSQPDGYFSAGVLTWTTGNNAGLSVTVKRQTGAEFELFLPTAFTFAAGDTFSIKAGCDKTLETCKNKFNNLNNYGGFPHIQQDINFR